MLKNKITKELTIFIGLFLFLAIGIHFKQWLDHPVEHFINLESGGAFGIPGLWHPFVFTFILYIAVGILRLLMRIFSTKR